jgi:lipoyl-dependent peroxiredoxin
MIRKADAQWKGGIKDGGGTLSLGSGAFTGNYSFSSRFENEKGTNPEELIGAAHAGCFSMAFSLFLEESGYKPEQIDTRAEVTIEKKDGDFTITKIHLVCKAKVPGIDEQLFQEKAKEAKENCPVSRALAGTQITLQASLG